MTMTPQQAIPITEAIAGITPKTRGNFAHRCLTWSAFIIGLSDLIWHFIPSSNFDIGRYLYLAALLGGTFSFFVLKPIAYTKLVSRELFKAEATVWLGLLFFTYATVSAFWSISPYSVTFSNAFFHKVLDLVAIIAITSLIGGKEMFRYWVSGSIIGAFILLITTLSGRADTLTSDYVNLTDPAIHHNMIGRFMATTSLITLIYFITEKRFPRWLLSFVGTIILAIGCLLTINKTSIIGLVGLSGVAILFGVYRGHLNIKSASGAAKIALTSALLIAIVGMFLVKTQEYEGLESLTGRTDIWDSASNFISKTPVFGRGRDSVLIISKGSRLLGLPNINQLHNQTVHTLFEYGLVGLAIEWLFYLTFALFLIKVHRQTSSKTLTPGLAQAELIAFCLFVFRMITGLTEGSEFLIFSPGLAIILVAYLKSEHGIYLDIMKHQELTQSPGFIPPTPGFSTPSNAAIATELSQK